MNTISSEHQYMKSLKEVSEYLTKNNVIQPIPCEGWIIAIRKQLAGKELQFISPTKGIFTYAIRVECSSNKTVVVYLDNPQHHVVLEYNQFIHDIHEPSSNGTWALVDIVER